MKQHANQSKESIAELEKQRDDWKNRYLRVLADYQNLEKRGFGEKEQVRRFAAEKLLKALLPIVDTLELAQAHLQDKGLGLALKQAFAVLWEQGVEKLEVLGKEFNPHEMECIEVVSGQENKVVAELLPGYKLHNKVIRAAQVKVGRKQIDNRAPEPVQPVLHRDDNV